MLKLINRTLYSFAPLALLLAASSAHASVVVTYTDPAVWTTASNGITTIDFEHLAPTTSPWFQDEGTSAGLTVNGVQFIGFRSTSTFGLQVVDSGLASPFYNFGSGASLRSPAYDNPPVGFTPYVHVIFPSSVSAFGIDLMTVSPNGLTYKVTLANGSSYNVPTGTRPTRTFFGVTSDTPITYADFALLGTSPTGGSFGLMDNVRIGTAAPETPEVASLLLIGTGLLCLGMLRRVQPANGRRRRNDHFADQEGQTTITIEHTPSTAFPLMMRRSEI